MNLKDIRKMKRAIQPRPVDDISAISSLQDNFAYSILVNTKYKDEIEGYSIVELSNWLKKNNITSDYDLIQLTIDADEDN